MYNITFHSETDSFPPVQIKGIPAGYSIVEVAMECDIDLHHNCGMVCSCSSCHIYVNEGAEFLEKADDRELEFIKRAKGPTPKSRLACQCILIDKAGNLDVTIPDQSILGD